MVAVAMRIAERMGMQYKSSYSTPSCSPLEAEMRRKLWWSLVLYDHRICEIVGQEKSSSLSPTWDCRTPLNVNDFEMQADMTKAPAKQDTSATEALFVVVPSELADFVRHSESHLAIIGGKPPPDMAAQPDREDSELEVLETMMQDKYLARCNLEIPLYYMTLWNTRGFFARSRLMEHYLTHAATASERPTDAERTIAYGHATRMLECDTQLRTSPLTKGYLWLVESWYSPVLAYFHVLNGLAKRPGEAYADKAWGAICDNYEALATGPKYHRTRLMFALKFSRIALQAWEARKTLRQQQNSPPELLPRLVVDARNNVTQMGLSRSPSEQSSRGPAIGPVPSFGTGASSGAAMSSVFPTPSLDLDGLQVSEGVQDFVVPSTPAGLFPDVAGQDCMDMGMDQFWSEKAFKWI